MAASELFFLPLLLRVTNPSQSNVLRQPFVFRAHSQDNQYTSTSSSATRLASTLLALYPQPNLSQRPLEDRDGHYDEVAEVAGPPH